ncbi:MAG: hypothetical protein ABIF88_01970 [archaeon]
MIEVPVGEAPDKCLRGPESSQTTHTTCQGKENPRQVASLVPFSLPREE